MTTKTKPAPDEAPSWRNDPAISDAMDQARQGRRDALDVLCFMNDWQSEGGSEEAGLLLHHAILDVYGQGGKRAESFARVLAREIGRVISLSETR